MVCGEEQDRFRHNFEDAESVLVNNLTEVPSSGSSYKEMGTEEARLAG